ncbi:hypothetical protein BC830DRAFT_1098050 [Chytriomyces sp. MP71]|nr:hypothetical protein BC830DRAFT_1098050 [Chytriomyces sp. MP71]
MASPFGYKIVNDPIHGQIRLDSYCWAVIDTPQFQRLRDLKQLGSAYMVFPGASHNRFEHSLGVAHLSNQLVTHLQRGQPGLDIEDFEVKCVTLAGLAHDLGHGPFSHIFDGHFIPRMRPGSQWTHEQASEMMLELLVQSNGVYPDQISSDDLKFVKALIRGSDDVGSGHQKMYLFDIVNNKRNSVDVDKFDYIGRDSLYLGMKCGFDYQRSMQFTRVIENQICWNKNEALNLCQLFQTRFNLFKQVYCHKVGKAVELMLVDVLCAADEYLQISSAIDDVERYMHLTDAVLKEVERSRAPELEKARQLMKRIRLRDLYRCADTFLLPPNLAGRITKQSFTKQRVLQYASASEMKKINSLSAEIHLEYLVLNWCFGDDNPIDRCGFFTKFEPETKFNMTRSQLSHMIPAIFQEVSLRIFVTHDDIRLDVQHIFRRFVANLEHEYPTAGDYTSLEHNPSEHTLNGSMPFFDESSTFQCESDTQKRDPLISSGHFVAIHKSSSSSTNLLHTMARLTDSEEWTVDLSTTGIELPVSFKTPVKKITGMEVDASLPHNQATAKHSRNGSGSSNISASETIRHRLNLVEVGVSQGSNLPENYVAVRNMSPQKKRKFTDK